MWRFIFCFLFLSSIVRAELPSDPKELFSFLRDNFDLATDPISKSEIMGWHAGGMVGHPKFPGKILPKLLVVEEKNDFRIAAIHTPLAVASGQPRYYENLDPNGVDEVRRLVDQYWTEFGHPEFIKSGVFYKEDHGNGNIVEHWVRKNGSYLIMKVFNVRAPKTVAYVYFSKKVSPE